MTNLEEALITWSDRQAAWQQDLLRRLAAGEVLGSADYRVYADAATNTELAKGKHWYSNFRTENDQDFQPLTGAHVTATHASEAPVRISQVVHLQGANDLAAGACLNFEPTGLTIIAGKNGSGKSGFTRILKQFAATRASEQVLPNAFKPEVIPKASVIFRVGDGAGESELTWEHGTDKVESPIQRVRVFDSRSASVHLAGATEIAYVPPTLQVLGHYTNALQEISALLEADLVQERLSSKQWPKLESGVGLQIFERLGTQEGLLSLRSVMPLTSVEAEELKQIPKKISELTTSNPAAQAVQARQISNQLKALARSIQLIAEKISPSNFDTVQTLQVNYTSALRGVDEARLVFDEAVMPPGTGNESWRKMWIAAKEFADGDEHRHDFPARFADCPLCVQSLGDEAKTRLGLFAHFMNGEAQTKLASAKSLWEQEQSSLTSLEISTLVDDDVSELIRSYDQELAASVTTGLVEAELLRETFLKYPEEPSSEENVAAGQTVEEIPDLADVHDRMLQAVRDLCNAAQSESDKAASLASTDSSADAVKTLSERQEALTLRQEIAAQRDIIGDQHDREIRIACLVKAKAACGTTSASRKNTELSENYVTAVCQQFEKEVNALGLDRVPVELLFDRSSRGVSYIKVAIKNASSSSASEILSEGEQRVTAIAGFFADLTESGDKSTLIFDDPVSSLDQEYRVKVAQRLLEEAAERQVLVFTHDFSFVQYLYEEKSLADKRKLAAQQQPADEIDYLHIARSSEGAGVLTNAEMWRHASVKERLGRLRSRQQAAASLYRKNDMVLYEKEARDIVGAIRETWELFVELELLDGVVKRHERNVQTQRLSRLLDLDSSDVANVDIGMTVESRYMTGHAAPVSDGSSPQHPDWLLSEIDALATYRKSVLDRRR